MSDTLTLNDKVGQEANSSLFKYQLDAKKVTGEAATVSFEQKDYTYLAVARVSHGKIDGRVVNEDNWIFKLETTGDPHGEGAETGEIYWKSLWKYDLTVGEGESATVKNVRVCERAVSDIKGVIDNGGGDYVVQFNDGEHKTEDAFSEIKISDMKVYRVLTSELTNLGLKLNSTEDGDEELNKAYEKRDDILELLTGENAKAVDVTKAYVDTVLDYAADGADAAAKQLKGSDFNKLLTTETVKRTALLDDIILQGLKTNDNVVLKEQTYDVVNNDKYYNGTVLNEVIDLNAEGAKELTDIEIAPDNLIGTGITPHTEGKQVGEFSYTVKDGEEDVELDTIAFGNDGNDTITGTTGNDYIDGGADNDKIFGGIGTAINEEEEITAPTVDILKGGEGNDVIVGGSEDAVEFTESGDVKVVVDEEGNENRLIDSEKLTEGITEIYGGEGNDVIVGGKGINTINAGNGNNKVYAEYGYYNSITTGSGSDTIYSGNASDTIYSGKGTAKVPATDTTPEVPATVDEIYGGKGNDTIVAGDRGAYKLNIDEQTGATTETVVQDKLTLGNANIFGGEGDDTIVGGKGENIIVDEDGNNTILAEYGTSADITTGTGNDTIKAGINATIIDDGGENTIVTGGGANITVKAGENKITAGENSTITTGNGDDIIEAVSGTINAGTGDNKVTFTGVGTVTTSDGDDTIVAKQGSTIFAGAGHNTIELTANDSTEAVTTISFEDTPSSTTTISGIKAGDKLNFVKTISGATPTYEGIKLSELSFERVDVAASVDEEGNAVPAHNDLIISYGESLRYNEITLTGYFNKGAVVGDLILNVLGEDGTPYNLSLKDNAEIQYTATGAFKAEAGYKEIIFVDEESQVEGTAPISSEFDDYIKRYDENDTQIPAKPVQEEYNDGIYSYYFKNPNTLENTYIDSLVIANNDDAVMDSTGNDVVMANSITSGKGDDTLIGVADNSSSTIGADLKSHFGRDSIIGTNKDDTIDASTNNDGVHVKSLGGMDTIKAGNGDNIIIADGAAKITTGSGVDVITAGAGATINSGDGNDVIVAGEGSKIYAGNGNNIVTLLTPGTNPDDEPSPAAGIISTSSGNDTIIAAHGSKIYAGAGDNTITLEGDVKEGTKIYFLDGVAGTTTIKGIGYKAAVPAGDTTPATPAVANTLSFVKITRDNPDTEDVNEREIDGLTFEDLTFTRVDEAAKYDDEDTEVAAAHNDLVISYGEGETAGEVVLYDFFKNGAVVGDLNLEVLDENNRRTTVSLLEKGVIKYVASGAVKGTDYVEEIKVDPDSLITSRVGDEFNAYIKRVGDTSTDTKYIVEEKVGDMYFYKYDNIYKDDEESVNYADSIVWANNKNDTITAGDFLLEEGETANNDVLIGHKLNGGYGNDLLIGTTADYTEGTDIVTKGATLIAGFEGNDTLIGTDKDDIINAFFNRDGVYINAKDGKDKIEGGAGDDIIIAEGEGTVIDAGAGDDKITAGAVSEITGGEGDDIITAGTGNKIYFLEEDDFGDDTVINSNSQTANTSTLVFAENVGTEDEPIYSGLKFSELSFARNDVEAEGTQGQPGYKPAHKDLLIASSKGTVTLEGYFDNTQNINKITALDETGVIKDYTISNDANVYVALDLLQDAPANYPGNSLSETIIGTDAANTIRGGDGNDTIYGGKGSDKLYGNDGNDTIYAGTLTAKGVKYNENAVEIKGGDGDDIIYSGTGNDTIAGGRGNDTIYLNGGKNSLYFIQTTAANVDKNVVYNSTNNDILYFAKKSDNSSDVFGHNFNDLTFNKAGNDLLIKAEADADNGTYAETVTLKNYYKSANRTDVIYALNDEGELEKYSISKQAVTEITIAPDAKANYKGENGNVTINASGFESADGVKGMTITTGKGENKIYGTGFNDNIKAAKASKLTLVEEFGNNKIQSGKGDDKLTAAGYSSNTANLGAGSNTVTLANIGTNKITTTGSGKNKFTIGFVDTTTVALPIAGTNTISTGKGDDTFEIVAGYNTIKTKGGYNDFIVNGGVNKLTSGAKDDDFTITDGNNKINTGKGSDELTISGGYNTITTNGSSTFNLNVNAGNDTSYNTINAKGNAKSKNTFNINYGANVIKAAAGTNTFNIKGGTSNITGGKNVDTFNIEGSNIIATLNGGKGNDVYDLTKFNPNDADDKVVIKDTKGKNELLISADDDLYTMFDVKLGKKNKYTASKEMTINESGQLEDSNIKYTGNVKYINNKAFDVTGIASEVAKWLRENTSCTSAFEAIEKQVDGVGQLIELYNVNKSGL